MGLENFKSDSNKDSIKQKDLGKVGRLLPTVELIEDDDIIEGVKKYVDEEVPGYFWKAPAASSGKHHHPISVNERGLWAHTLMAATALEEKYWSYLEMGTISYHELDCARAAILLHDTKKYGHKYWDGKYADHDHDTQAAEAIRGINGLPETVAECVETHMGPSSRYDGPDPRNPLEMLVHQCDMVASTKRIEPGIYKPPEEITRVNSDITEIEEFR